MLVLGPPHHSGQGKGILWNYVQRVTWVTQGDPLSPTIFNSVVYAKIRYWITVVVVEEAGGGGFGRAVQMMEAFFYATDGLLVSMHTDWLSGALYILTKLFKLYGLQTNLIKMVGMVYHTCTAAGRHSDESYGIWMVMWGLTYQYHLRQGVGFPECTMELAEASLVAYRQIQNGVS